MINNNKQNRVEHNLGANDLDYPQQGNNSIYHLAKNMKDTQGFLGMVHLVECFFGEEMIEKVKVLSHCEQITNN